MTIRWVTIIEADGSALFNLDGRAATLADGLSRAHKEHVRFLREQCHNFKNLKMADLLDDYEEADVDPEAGFVHGVGRHALPVTEKERASAAAKAQGRSDEATCAAVRGAVPGAIAGSFTTKGRPRSQSRRLREPELASGCS